MRKHTLQGLPQIFLRLLPKEYLVDHLRWPKINYSLQKKRKPTKTYRASPRNATVFECLGAVRQAHRTLRPCVLGSDKFQDEITAILGRRAKIAPLGRPKKPKDGAKE
ncbi:MAG: hypothetical protein ACXWT0_17225 [Methylobacter sp.]